MLFPTMPLDSGYNPCEIYYACVRGSPMVTFIGNNICTNFIPNCVIGNDICDKNVNNIGTNNTNKWYHWKNPGHYISKWWVSLQEP